MKMNSKSQVRVVIPCRNERNYIGLCLDSLLACNKEFANLSVQVVDGMSDDGTRSIVESYAEKFDFISLLDNEKKTTPFALNMGVKSLDFDIAIILGAHAVVDKFFIDRNVKVLNDKPDVGCSGGFIHNIHENEWSEIISVAMSSPFGVGNANFRTGRKSGYVDTLAFGAYRREVFEKIGFFDEELARNQDDEFNFRMMKSGFKIFLDDSIHSSYFVRASISKLSGQYDQYGYWKVFVNRKHRAITSLRQLAPPLWVLYVVSGWLGYFVHPLFLVWYCLLISVYIGLSVFMAMHYRMKTFFRFVKLLQAFWTLHFSYGMGYLRGIFHFYVLDKKPSDDSIELTR